MLKAKDKLSYTILEVILIILLVVVWLGVTLPRFGAGDLLNRYRLRTTVYNIGSDMRSTRAQAITKGGTDRYSIRFESNQYQIIAPGGEVIETKELPSGITWSCTSQYDFTSLGEADWTIGSGITTFLTASGEQWTIAVIRPTGIVRIQKP